MREKEKRMKKKMNFKELKESVGMTMALEIMLHNGKGKEIDQLVGPLSFNGWKVIYQEATSGGDLEKIAFEQMLALAEDFKDWTTVYLCAPEDTDLENALEQMKEKGAFDDWRNVLGEHRWGKNLGKTVLEQLLAAEGTFDDWRYVYIDAPYESNLKKVAFEQMKALARHVMDWQAVHMYAHKDIDLQKKALGHMKARARHVMDWTIVYLCAPVDSDTEKTALEYMKESDLTFEYWEKTYLKARNDKRKTVLEQMEALAEDFNDWKIVHRYALALEGSDLKKTALENMQKFVELENF